MTDRPKYSLTGAVLCLTVGGLWLYFMSGPAMWVGTFAAYFLALLLLIDWYVGRRSEDARALLRADPNAPTNVLFTLAQLTPEMQENLIASRVLVDAVPNFAGPDKRWRFPGSEEWFYDSVMCAVWSKATELDGMPAIRSFGDETNPRRCCIAMTTFFVSCGWLKRAAGNMTAQWNSGGYQSAYRSLFGEG